MLLNDFYVFKSFMKEGQTIEATIALNGAHDIFKGHFPNSPVVPGVCLMTMVKETLEKGLSKSFVLQEAKSVKFLGIVNPNETEQLQVRCDFTPQENGTIKTNSVITAGDKVCYKASAVYA